MLDLLCPDCLWKIEKVFGKVPALLEEVERSYAGHATAARVHHEDQERIEQLRDRVAELDLEVHRLRGKLGGSIWEKSAARLRERAEKAEAKVRRLTQLLDAQLGTPCLQIRYQELEAERDAMRAVVEAARGLLAEAHRGQYPPGYKGQRVSEARMRPGAFLTIKRWLERPLRALDTTTAEPKPPRTLQEVLEQNRALVAAAPAGVRAVYKMNREFETRRGDTTTAEEPESE